MVGLVAGNILPSLNVVLMSFVSSYLSTLRGMIMVLMANSSRPRMYADVIVITLDDNLVSATMSLVMPMPVVIVVVVSMIVVPWVR